MKIKNLLTITLGVSLLMSLEVNAQIDTLANLDSIPEVIKEVKIKAKQASSGVVVRWAPSTPSVWVAGNNNGYRLYRQEVIEGQELDEGTPELIATLKVRENNNWFQELEQEGANKYEQIAWQCIYGEYESMEMGEGIGAWVAQADELKNRFTFALFAAEFDPLAANYSALRYEDKTAVAGKKYLYRVLLDLPDDYDLQYTANGIIVGKDSYQEPDVPVYLIEGEGALTLKWDKDLCDPHYSAYNIERSKDGKNFKVINKFPYVFGSSGEEAIAMDYISYTDSVPNYQDYQYRISALNSFGEWKLFSTIVKGMARDMTPPAVPEILDAREIPGPQIEISWLTVDDSDLAGYHIYRGHTHDDRFYKINQNILPRNTSSYIDKTPLFTDRNYYFVSAIDTAGNESASVAMFGMIRDTTPPEIPTGLVGSVDTLGNVTISWDKNSDYDILGYKVFYANAKSHDFVLISGQPVRDTSFNHKVSLKSLSSNVYYKIMAVDGNYNYSDRTEPIVLNRPDTIPPVASLFKDYQVEENGILLKWANSRSDDLKSQNMMRRSEDEEQWTLLKTLSRADAEFVDADIQSNTWYYYKIVAEDLSGNKRDSPQVLKIRSHKSKAKNGVARLDIKKDENNKPSLSWTTNNIKTQAVVIYRKSENEGLKRLEILKNGEERFIDRSAKLGKTYDYTIQLRLDNGDYTNYSDFATIEM